MIRTKLDIFALLLLFSFVAGETYKGLLIGMSGCPDFDNQVVNSDNLELQVTEDGENMQIAGYITIHKEIDDSCIVQLKVIKETEAGNEPIMGAVGDLCVILKDYTAPWYSMAQDMNITSCPIKEGQYPMKNVYLDMGFADDVLNHDNCGDYIVKFVVTCGVNEMISCHDLGMSIVEHKDDEE